MADHTFQHARIKPFPLSQRKSLTTVDEILIDPDGLPPDLDATRKTQMHLAAEKIRAARSKEAAVILFYGAHLLRNGAPLVLERLMAGGWITIWPQTEPGPFMTGNTPGTENPPRASGKT